jgi:hypothetical protein
VIKSGWKLVLGSVIFVLPSSNSDVNSIVQAMQQKVVCAMGFRKLFNMIFFFCVYCQRDVWLVFVRDFLNLIYNAHTIFYFSF